MTETTLPNQGEKSFLNLKRPIIFFDLETTGTDTQKDRIVEISAIKHSPDGTLSNLYFVINPTIPIPPEASQVHGYTDEMVADKQRFCDVEQEVYEYFKDCDLAGYNIKKFDIPLLMEEFGRCKKYPILLTETKIVDSMTVYHKKEPRDLTAAVKFYCNEEFDKAHSAQADVEATMKVLRHQLITYSDLEPNIEFLHDFTCNSEQIIDFSGKFARNKQGQVVFNFEKHKGEAVNLDQREHADYFIWMERNMQSVEVRMAVKRIKNQHKCHKDCLEWLQIKNIITDVSKSFALYKAILSEADFRPFSVSRDGKKLIVTYSESCEPPLVLCDEDARHVSLLILKTYFNSMGGLEYIQSTLSTED